MDQKKKELSTTPALIDLHDKTSSVLDRKDLLRVSARVNSRFAILYPVHRWLEQCFKTGVNLIRGRHEFIHFI